jgi:hypothetical protein
LSINRPLDPKTYIRLLLAILDAEQDLYLGYIATTAYTSYTAYTVNTAYTVLFSLSGKPLGKVPLAVPTGDRKGGHAYVQGMDGRISGHSVIE